MRSHLPFTAKLSEKVGVHLLSYFHNSQFLTTHKLALGQKWRSLFSLFMLSRAVWGRRQLGTLILELLPHFRLMLTSPTASSCVFTIKHWFSPGLNSPPFLLSVLAGLKWIGQAHPLWSSQLLTAQFCSTLTFKAVSSPIHWTTSSQSPSTSLCPKWNIFVSWNQLLCSLYWLTASPSC